MNTSDDRLKVKSLVEENQQYQGTGGVSEGNRALGFVPGFLNTVTGDVFLSCFSNGRPAPVHLLDGLPAHAVRTNRVTGRACALQEGVISGFVFGRKFYTREEACLAAVS